MSGWSFYNPVDVRFGLDALDGIGDLVAGRRYVLVTYGDAPLRPVRDRIASLAGPPLAVIDEIEPNPSLSGLRPICDRLRALDRAPELLVALGGGSVIDSTKFLAAGRGRWEPVRDYLETGRHDGTPALRILAVPTTSGTGSDVTSWATIWDPERDRKLSLARLDLYTQAVIVDPRLTATLPLAVTTSSGLDALSQPSRASGTSTPTRSRGRSPSPRRRTSWRG